MAEKLYFYKREPALFLGGIAHMTVEQIAVYSVLLELMYDKWEPVADRGVKQRRDLARTCGLSVRKFGTVLEELLAADKIQRTLSGRLSNRKFEQLARQRGVDTAATFDKIAEKPVDNLGDNRPDNEGALNNNKGLEGENSPVHARVELEARSKKPDSSAPPPPSKPGKTGFENLHDLIEGDITQICRALGVHLESHPGAHNWPHQWVRLQAEKQITLPDMLEAIASYGDQPIVRTLKSLFWLKDRAIEKRVARELGAAIVGRSATTTATAAHGLTREQWHAHLVQFLALGSWPTNTAGPSPLQPGCLAPADLIAKAEAAWVQQGNHPEAMHHGGARVPWQPGKAGAVREVIEFAPRS